MKLVFIFNIEGQMNSDNININRIEKLILIVLFLILILQFFSISSILASDGQDNNSDQIRQIGKSDVTITTADVYNAGLDVPEEYVNEVAMIQFSDTEPIEGERIIINATVFNVGTRGASATVYFYDGPPENKDLIGMDNLSIHALGYQIASTPWNTTGEEEYHTIYVLINPDDPENESNNDNNQASRDIVVNQIPFANAGEDLGFLEIIYEDDVVEFDGSRSNDTESDLTTGLIFTWQFNDPFANDSNPDTKSGNNLTTPSHIFTHNGLYEVNLTVSDDGGAFAKDSVIVKVLNAEPKAEITSSEINIDEDEEIIFNALNSWDTPTDKVYLKYYWSFGDGTSTGWVNKSTINHSYPYQDTYTVTLMIKDDDGLTDTVSIDINVRNVPPVADAGGDLELYESTIEFDASRSWDTLSDLKTLQYSWNFGDGTLRSGIKVIHTYSVKKEYQVKLTVTDDDYKSSSDSITVTIKNLSPIAVLKTDKIITDEDSELSFDGSGSYDPDGEIVEYNWDFGDGTTKTSVYSSHTYTRSGSYLVTLTVEDDEFIIGKDTVKVTIENLPPVANAGSDIEIYLGEDAFFDASNSSDTFSDFPLLRYNWDFGDNTTGQGIRINHTYQFAGNYEVILTVIDDNNFSAIHDIRVFVRKVMLSSILITAEIDPTTCQPGENVEVSGTIDLEFVKNNVKPDFTIIPVRIELVETGDFWTVVPELEGDFWLEFIAPEDEGIYTVKISITRLGLLAEETQTLTVTSKTIEPGSQGLILDINTTVIIISLGTIVGGLGTFTAGTDLGRYSFFTFLIPLYSRLNREALLDNFTRGRIYEHIRMNPGQHYRAIRSTLGLSNGSLAYHLKVLEKENYIKSASEGLCKRFYPAGMKILDGQPHNIQEIILEKIYEHPYITQKQLAQEIGIDISTVNYHVNIMAGAGIIKAEKSGRTKHYIVEAELAEPS